jgi:hypothetical protein
MGCHNRASNGAISEGMARAVCVKADSVGDVAAFRRDLVGRGFGYAHATNSEPAIGGTVAALTERPVVGGLGVRRDGHLVDVGEAHAVDVAAGAAVLHHNATLMGLSRAEVWDWVGRAKITGAGRFGRSGCRGPAGEALQITFSWIFIIQLGAA